MYFNLKCFHFKLKISFNIMFEDEDRFEEFKVLDNIFYIVICSVFLMTIYYIVRPLM